MACHKIVIFMALSVNIFWYYMPQSQCQFREKSCATSPRTEVASHNVTRFLSAPKTFFQPTKNGNEQCFLKKLKSNLFFFYSRALALIHCLVFSSRVKRWQHSNHFCGFMPKKEREKKEKNSLCFKIAVL